MPRLLLVDDNPSIHKIAESLLSGSDVQVVCAESGTQALSLVAQGERFDAALIDIFMSTMDGWALLDALRMHPVTAAMPVAMMAGVLDTVDPARLAQARVQGYVKKPVELRDLPERVRTLIASEVPMGIPEPATAELSPFATAPALRVEDLRLQLAEALHPGDLLVLTPEDLLPAEEIPVAVGFLMEDAEALLPFALSEPEVASALVAAASEPEAPLVAGVAPLEDFPEGGALLPEPAPVEEAPLVFEEDLEWSTEPGLEDALVPELTLEDEALPEAGVSLEGEAFPETEVTDASLELDMGVLEAEPAPIEAEPAPEDTEPAVADTDVEVAEPLAPLADSVELPDLGPSVELFTPHEILESAQPLPREWDESEELLSAIQASLPTTHLPETESLAPGQPTTAELVSPGLELGVGAAMAAGAAAAAAAEPSGELPPAPPSGGVTLEAAALVEALLADPVALERLAKALSTHLSTSVLREVAWEVLPDLADRLHHT